jgi:hypothetical protein
VLYLCPDVYKGDNAVWSSSKVNKRNNDGISSDNTIVNILDFNCAIFVNNQLTDRFNGCGKCGPCGYFVVYCLCLVNTEPRTNNNNNNQSLPQSPNTNVNFWL